MGNIQQSQISSSGKRNPAVFSALVRMIELMASLHDTSFRRKPKSIAGYDQVPNILNTIFAFQLSDISLTDNKTFQGNKCQAIFYLFNAYSAGYVLLHRRPVFAAEMSI
jgi:hypothetical protein